MTPVIDRSIPLVGGLVVVDHGSRHGWARFTGARPGEERPEEE